MFASKVKLICGLIIVGKQSISATGPVFINQELTTYSECVPRAPVAVAVAARFNREVVCFSFINVSYTYIHQCSYFISEF